MLNVIVKDYEKLTKAKLYDLLRLRSEVFVVEQDCVYQDIDGKDQKALHVLGYKNNVLIAYTRLFKPGDYFNEASIGRVVVRETERIQSYGYDIMKVSIDAVATYYSQTEIRISAQQYLKNFYNKLGFTALGDEYLEDGIPHIKMLKH